MGFCHNEVGRRVTGMDMLRSNQYHVKCGDDVCEYVVIRTYNKHIIKSTYKERKGYE